MREIRQLHEQDKRVETGPVQFGEDWPGVFIRGDNAAYYAQALKHLLESEAGKGLYWLDRGQLEGLQSLLSGAVVGPAASFTEFTEVAPGVNQLDVQGGIFGGLKPAVPWLERAERLEDMSAKGRLRLWREDDGDVIVEVLPEEDGLVGNGASVQFCIPGTGGGRSPKTHAALLALMEAMAEDNREQPSRAPACR